MNLLFSVWGGSVAFANTTENSTGNVEYIKFIDFLCDFDNVEKVVIACPTDAAKSAGDFFFPIKNKHKLVFPLVETKQRYAEQTKKVEMKAIKEGLDEEDVNKAIYKEKTKHLNRSIKELGITIDIGFVFRGLGSFCYGTLADYCMTDKGTYRIPPRTALGAAQVTYYLNAAGIPWHLIGTDSRYFRNAIGNRDVSNMPISGLCQYEEELKWRHIKKFSAPPNTDEVDDTFKIEYAAIEMVSGYKEKPPTSSIKRKQQDKMIVFSNWIDFKSADYKKNFRYKIIKKWIIDTSMDCVIYGKWSEDCLKENKEFGGHIEAKQFHRIMDSMKCTFVLPQKIGWSTWKIWEMIYRGVVPFLHPMYDNQFHTVPEDHFIRVKNVDDLVEKFNRIINEKNLYENTITDLFEYLDPQCNKIAYAINNVHEKHGIELLNSKEEVL